MKLTKRRLSLILVCIILIIVAAVTLRFLELRQGREDGAAQPQASDGDAPASAAMALTNVHQTSVKDGIKEWHLDADAATYLEAEQKMMLTHPRVEFYTHSGETMILTAREGVLDTATNDIQVSGEVEIHHQRYTLSGTAFTYTHADKTLISRLPVEIHSDRLDLKANSLVVDLDTRQAELAGNVKGRIHESLSL
jgi:LPS export ABC transporter protein LptC